MQGNGENTNEEQSKANDSTIGEKKPLFSRREIRAIVKDFISAWLSGQIKIKFLTCAELLNEAKLQGEQLTYKKASQQEIDLKMELKNCINICVGAVKATSEEQNRALESLFDRILTFRNGNRIEGKFMAYELEQRIQRLEEGLGITNNLVQEMIEWLYRGRTGHDQLP